MSDIYYPTEEQLFGLYKFLVLLRNSQIYWFTITMSGDIIKLKVEEPKGEIDLRLFYIDKNGEVIPDDWENRLY